MMMELLVAGVLQLGGISFVLAAGVRRSWLALPLGYITGAALLVVTSSLHVVTLQRILVIPALATVALAPVVWLALVWRKRIRGSLERRGLLVAALSIPGSVATAALLSIQGRVNFHSDSFEYLALAHQLATDRFAEAFSLAQLEKRMLGTASLHAPAELVDGYFVATITPMIAISCLLLVAGFAAIGLQSRLSPGWATTVGASAALFLLTMNRFLFNAFYINGHLLFATLLLVIAGGAWLGAKRRDEGIDRQVLPIQLAAIPAIIVTRPEAGFAVLLALAPTLLDAARPLRHRLALALTTGTSLAVWSGFLIVLSIGRDTAPNRSMLGLFALGVLVSALSWILRFRWLTGYRRRWLWIGEAGLWLVLLVLALREPDVLTGSLSAAFENILRGEGGWGLSFNVLLIGAVLVIALLREEDRIHLRYPVTTFLPLVFILAYLRGSPYRAHIADSLNRMAFQIVPLAVLLIAASAGAVWVWTRRRMTTRSEAVRSRTTEAVSA